MVEPRALLLEMFAAVVDAASPKLCVPSFLPAPPRGRTLVVEAGHPVPDEAGAAAAARMLQMVQGLTEDDLVLCLMSGGASSLLSLPAPGIDLPAKQAVNPALLRSGAAIGDMNTVRKHLSAIKGGRLAEAVRPAQMLTLMISDVPGDDPSVIGSGPTVPDIGTLAQARAVLSRYGISAPDSVAARLNEPAAETPKPGHPAFAHTRAVLVATPMAALKAAAAVAHAAGWCPFCLGTTSRGRRWRWRGTWRGRRLRAPARAC